jgi:DNA-binding NarL/FixJ family response regulator
LGIDEDDPPGRISQDDRVGRGFEQTPKQRLGVFGRITAPSPEAMRHSSPRRLRRGGSTMAPGLPRPRLCRPAPVHGHNSLLRRSSLTTRKSNRYNRATDTLRLRREYLTMDESPIGILLAEDNPADIEIIRRSLHKGGLTNPLVVARDGQSALDLLRDAAPRFGVVILDIHLPKVGGLEVLKEAKSVDPELVVIMLTGQASFQTAVQALRHEGAFDYVQKSKDDLPDLVEAVRLALKKHAVRRQTLWTVGSQADGTRTVDMHAIKERFDLSDREVDVIKRLCRGDTNKEIAERLFISDLTVKGHLKHIYQKIGVHTRSAVVSTVLANAPSTTARSRRSDASV